MKRLMHMLTALLFSTSLTRVAAQEAAGKSSIDDRLSKLGHERGQFESILRGENAGRMISMMMGAGNDAYFPIGVSSRRYLVRQIRRPYSLEFQSLHGNYARVDWRLVLNSDRGPKPKAGTLRLILWNEGFGFNTRRLTKSQKASLNAVTDFAFYSPHFGNDFLGAGFVHRDGRMSTFDKYSVGHTEGSLRPGILPITADEASLLGLGSKRWYGSGKVNLIQDGESSLLAKLPFPTVQQSQGF